MDSQIEQDLLLTRATVGISSDPLLKDQVAMRGGTALHKVHLAPARRYSEDIDLVLVGARPIHPDVKTYDVDRAAEIVRRVFLPHLE